MISQARGYTSNLRGKNRRILSEEAAMVASASPLVRDLHKLSCYPSYYTVGILRTE